MALEINDDPTFARREWRVQRIGWLGILGLVFAASAGALGRGPLASREVGDAMFHVQYDRILRHDAPAPITVQWQAPGQTEHDTLGHVWANEAFLDACSPTSIMPSPTSTQMAGGDVEWHFHVSPGAGPMTVTITCNPEHIGSHVGIIGSEREKAYSLRMFVLP